MDKPRKWVRQIDEDDWVKLCDAISDALQVLLLMAKYADTHREKRAFVSAVRTITEKLQRLTYGTTTSLTVPKDEDSQVPF